MKVSSPMDVILYLCIILTLLVLFLIVYAWTLPMFPDEWRKKVNSNLKSYNPRYNNDAITGFLIIIIAIAALIMWLIYVSALFGLVYF